MSLFFRGKWTVGQRNSLHSPEKNRSLPLPPRFREAVVGTAFVEQGRLHLYTGDNPKEKGWTTLDTYPENRTFSRRVTFCGQFSHNPDIVLALSGLDLLELPGRGPSIHVYASDVRLSSFVVNVATQRDDQLYSVFLAWMALDPSLYDHSPGDLYQTGVLTLGPHTPSWSLHKVTKSDTTRMFKLHVPFETPFEDPPNVLVVLAGFEVLKGSNARLKADATFITRSGFEVHVLTAAKARIQQLSLHWLALDESFSSPHPLSGTPRIETGSLEPMFSTEGDKAWKLADATKKDSRSFAANVQLLRPFTVSPEVFVGLSGLDVEQGANLRILVYDADVSAASFVIRSETWWDTRVWGCSFSWVAFEPPLVSLHSGAFACLSGASAKR